MEKQTTVKAPFFEIAVKSYLYGDDVLELALAADAAAESFGSLSVRTETDRM